MPKTTEHNRGELMTDVAGRSSTRGLSFSSLLSAEIRIGCLISDKPFTMKCKLSSFQLEQMLRKMKAYLKISGVFFPSQCTVYCTAFFFFFAPFFFPPFTCLKYVFMLIYFLFTHTHTLPTSLPAACNFAGSGPFQTGRENRVCIIKTISR